MPIWLAILVTVSLMPDSVKYELGTKGAFHYIEHLIVFAITGLLFCWKSSSLNWRLACAVGGCSVALALEALEMIVYGNHFEWPDAWINCLGVMLGFAIAGLVRKKIEITA